jgi:hypothetical protein
MDVDDLIEQLREEVSRISVAIAAIEPLLKSRRELPGRSTEWHGEWLTGRAAKLAQNKRVLTMRPR